MSLQFTLREITADALDDLLWSAPESQAEYVAEIIPMDSDALARDQRRQFKRPLSQEDRDYLSGRLMYCPYSPSRVDLGPICLAIKSLFRHDETEEFPLGTLLTGYEVLPITVSYGHVYLFPLDNLPRNVARLRDAQSDLSGLPLSEWESLTKKLESRSRHTKIDAAELKDSILAQLNRLRIFFERTHNAGAMVIAYLN